MKAFLYKLRFAWENISRNRRIKFTWGGNAGDYTVYLRLRPAISYAYQPIITVGSCYEAQQLCQRLNMALKRWAPRLLHESAELPGVGFQYPKPQPHNQPQEASDVRTKG